MADDEVGVGQGRTLLGPGRQPTTRRATSVVVDEFARTGGRGQPSAIGAISLDRAPRQQSSG